VTPVGGRTARVLPGFRWALGFTLAYLGLFVLLPLSTVVAQGSSLGWAGWWKVVTSPRVLASIQLSIAAAIAAGIASVALGLLVAWVLARYRFPGRRAVNAIVDLPFALPTAVAGISLTALYGPNGWIGSLFAPLGLPIAFTRVGIVIALIFVGLPFVVRAVQPVLEDLERDVEEAAASLGATRWQVFQKVLLPTLRPAILTGLTLAFARGVGEYGSVVFISGNMPLRTEIAPLVIMTKLEQFDYAGAAAVAMALLVVSLLLLIAINARNPRTA
jgi:sulfate/thiosulfate transport system permease protein